MQYESIEKLVKGKTAFITGGTSGIGKACVELFCAAGVNVVTIGRSIERGQELEAEINHWGKGTCRYFPCDVKDLERLEKAVEFTAEEFGGIDYLVNVAGYFPKQAPIDEITAEMFDDVIQTNLRPYFMSCKYALPYLRTAHGSIVNIGSIVAVTGGEYCQAYCCTKGAIEAFTRSLAFDEAKNGVRVNEIKPGHINSAIYEQLVQNNGSNSEYCRFMDHVQVLGRGGRATEVAYTALFLVSDWASFITGAEIYVTGGYELGEAEKVPSRFVQVSPPIKK